MRSIPIHILLALSLGAAKLFLDNVLMSLIEGVALTDPRFLPNYAMFVSLTLHTQVLIYALIVCTALSVGYYRSYCERASVANALASAPYIDA